MRLRTRRLTSFAAALGLAAGVLTVTATSASAVPGASPQFVYGFGYYQGYEIGWSAPSDTTGLTGYTANVYLASDTTYTSPVQAAQIVPPSSDDDDLYADFDSLTPGQRYVGTVRADYGVGEASDVVAGDADYAYKPVGKVSSLKAKPGKKSLAVSWSGPATSNATGSIDFFVVTANNGAPTFVEPSQRSVTLAGLTNGRKYTVQVYAWAAAGPGAVASVAATPIGSPAKPTKFKRAWKKGGKAKLTWKNSKSTAAAPVTGYVVYVNGKKKATLSKGKTSYTAKGLKKGKKYSFSIKAYNSVGKSSSAKVASKKRP